MKAFILAAGLGTRLRPWTLENPKALVPVGGVPMLERVIINLRNQGFSKIVVNVHHFASKIVDFLDSHDFGVKISVSDESDRLLDTGGALLHARDLLAADNEPFLIHNVDILSNADLASLMQAHERNQKLGALSTLLVSNRKSSRKLIFSPDMELRGWHNLSTDEFRPKEFNQSMNDTELAFSGIHVMSPDMLGLMESRGMSGAFPIIDFLLGVASSGHASSIVRGEFVGELELIDIGKPDTLAKAESFPFGIG